MGERMNCRFFGYDPTTLLSAIVSFPYTIPNAITGIKSTLDTPQSLKSVTVYRTFGTCRQTYAVTPQGARWMMATVLRSMIIDGWGSGGGDSILAQAAVRDMFTHQTFFMRIFEQDEWCDPENNFACNYAFGENAKEALLVRGTSEELGRISEHKPIVG
jgi:hypothetical protein